jgi:hypothetical protein
MMMSNICDHKDVFTCKNLIKTSVTAYKDVSRVDKGWCPPMLFHWKVTDRFHWTGNSLASDFLFLIILSREYVCIFLNKFTRLK